MAAGGAAPNAKSVAGIWVSAAFVVGVFLLIWILAVLRLRRHTDAEAFLRRKGVTDSALALLAPVAMVARVLQARRDAFAGRQTGTLNA